MALNDSWRYGTIPLIPVIEVIVGYTNLRSHIKKVRCDELPNAHYILEEIRGTAYR